MKAVLLALSCALGSCAGVEFVVAPQVHRSDVERGQADEDEDEGLAPRAEIWGEEFGVVADYRAWDWDSCQLKSKQSYCRRIAPTTRRSGMSFCRRPGATKPDDHVADRSAPSMGRRCAS